MYLFIVVEVMVSLHNPGYTRTHYVDQDDLELTEVSVFLLITEIKHVHNHTLLIFIYILITLFRYVAHF